MVIFTKQSEIAITTINDIYYVICLKITLIYSEVATHRCSYKKVFWKYAVNLKENTHAEVRFQ